MSDPMFIIRTARVTHTFGVLPENFIIARAMCNGVPGSMDAEAVKRLVKYIQMLELGSGPYTVEALMIRLGLWSAVLLLSGIDEIRITPVIEDPSDG